MMFHYCNIRERVNRLQCSQFVLSYGQLGQFNTNRGLLGWAHLLREKSPAIFVIC